MVAGQPEAMLQSSAAHNDLDEMDARLGADEERPQAELDPNISRLLIGFENSKLCTILLLLRIRGHALWSKILNVVYVNSCCEHQVLTENGF